MADNPLGVRQDWLDPVTMRLSGHATEYAQTRIAVRDHTVITDEPPERGGLDGGPAPTELLIAALIGATTVFVRRMARRDAVLVESVTIEAEADLDRRGLWLTTKVPVSVARHSTCRDDSHRGRRRDNGTLAERDRRLFADPRNIAGCRYRGR